MGSGTCFIFNFAIFKIDSARLGMLCPIVGSCDDLKLCGVLSSHHTSISGLNPAMVSFYGNTLQFPAETHSHSFPPTPSPFLAALRSLLGQSLQTISSLNTPDNPPSILAILEQVLHAKISPGSLREPLPSCHVPPTCASLSCLLFFCGLRDFHPSGGCRGGKRREGHGHMGSRRPSRTSLSFIEVMGCMAHKVAPDREGYKSLGCWHWWLPTGRVWLCLGQAPDQEL